MGRLEKESETNGRSIKHQHSNIHVFNIYKKYRNKRKMKRGTKKRKKKQRVDVANILCAFDKLWYQTKNLSVAKALDSKQRMNKSKDCLSFYTIYMSLLAMYYLSFSLPHHFFWWSNHSRPILFEKKRVIFCFQFSIFFSYFFISAWIMFIVLQGTIISLFCKEQ